MHDRTCASRSAGRSMPAWPCRKATSATATAMCADTSRTCGERWKEAPLFEVLLRHLRGQRRRRGEEHLVGDAARTHGDRAEADAGEDVGVVALARDEGPAADRHRIERAAAGEQRLPAAPCVRLLGRALRLRGRIRQGEDDRARIERAHRFDHRLRECAGWRRHADQRGRLERADRGDEVGLRRMLVGVGQLVLGQVAAPTGDDEALGVEQPAAAPRLRRVGAACAPSPRRRDRRCRWPPRPRRGRAGAGRSSVPPVTRSAEHRPASATAAVPWMSSLKVQIRSRYFFSRRKALWLAKSSNWTTTPGKDLAGGGDELVDQLVVGRAGEARLGAGRGRAGRRAAPRCWCRRRASPAGTASGGCRRRRCRARACRPGSPCRWSRGRRGRGCARRR